MSEGRINSGVVERLPSGGKSAQSSVGGKSVQSSVVGKSAQSSVGGKSVQSVSGRNVQSVSGKSSSVKVPSEKSNAALVPLQTTKQKFEAQLEMSEVALTSSKQGSQLPPVFDQGFHPDPPDPLYTNPPQPTTSEKQYLSFTSTIHLPEPLL